MRFFPGIVRFTRAQEGVAAVEFALILPILVLLFFGAVELSNLLIADAKLRTVAASASDLVTQEDDSDVSTNELNIVNLAAAQIMLPLPVAGPRLAILISNYRPVSTTQARLVWSRIISGGGTSPQTGTVLGLTTPACGDTNLPATLLPKAAGSPFNDVVRVTAVYDWQPWFATIFNATIRLRSTNFNMPRYSLVLNGGTGITNCP